MAIRNLRYEGDPILRKTSKEVKEITPKIVELIDDMLETMYEAGGVGMTDSRFASRQLQNLI